MLSSGGSPVTAAQLGGWTPIAAQQTATGYEVALKAGNQYLVWNTDTSGNYALDRCSAPYRERAPRCGRPRPASTTI